jgi:hypothetical protein
MINPDYSKYSLEELTDILDRIEKEKYPDKVKLIEEQLRMKEANINQDENYSLFGQNRIQYRNKWFIIFFVAFVSTLSLINISNLLIQIKIISIIVLIIFIISLVLALSAHPKILLAIKGVSIVFFITGTLSVISVVLEILTYILSTSEEYIFDLKIFDTILGLILFFVGIFYFMKSDDYVIENKN